MHFIADENIPKELIVWLEKNGHKIFSCPKGSSDEEVAAFAKERNFPLLTLDRHFSNTLRFPPKYFPGIIRFKVHPSFLEDLIFSITHLLKVSPQEKDFQGKLIILEKDGYFKVKE